MVVGNHFFPFSEVKSYELYIRYKVGCYQLSSISRVITPVTWMSPQVSKWLVNGLVNGL